MEADAFEVCDAAYVWLCQWHGSQDSREYSLLSRLLRLYKPGTSVEFNQLDEQAQIVYEGFRDVDDVEQALLDCGVL